MADSKGLVSSAFSGALNQVRREQSAFRQMLTTYNKSPRQTTAMSEGQRSTKTPKKGTTKT
jgi:hypothetical protein